jgi:4-amino-4-deoxy-L-arabinose transferase-like glycosyltransferase
MTDRHTEQDNDEAQPEPSGFQSLLGLEKTSPEDAMVLILLVALAMTLRLQFVTEPIVDVFSWRQASTAMIAENIPKNGWNIFLPEVDWTGPVPSYQGREFQLLTLLAAIANELFGWHDWAGRAVAVMFSLITVVSLHRLTALVWGEMHAHAVTLVYALLPSAIMIDSSYLPDPAMLALVTAGIWLYLRFFLGGSRGLLYAAAITFALGALTKLPGMAAGLVPLWLISILILRGQTRRALASCAAMVGVIAIVVAYYGWAIHVGSSYPPFHIAGSGYIWELGFATLLENRFYLVDLWDVSIWWLYGYPLLALLAAGLWLFPPRAAGEGNGALIYLPLVWLISCVILYVVAAREITANPWNLHLFNVPFAFFAGHGLIALIRVGGNRLASWRSLWRLAMAGVIVILGSTLPLVSRMKDPFSEEARLLGNALRQMKAPDDLVVTISPDVGDPVAIYYSRGRGWVFPPGGGQNIWSVFSDDGAPAISQLEDLIAQGARWFGYAKNAKDDLGRSFVEHHTGLIGWLEQNATLARETRDFVIYRLPEAS